METINTTHMLNDYEDFFFGETDKMEVDWCSGWERRDDELDDELDDDNRMPLVSDLPNDIVVCFNNDEHTHGVDKGEPMEVDLVEMKYPQNDLKDERYRKSQNSHTDDDHYCWSDPESDYTVQSSAYDEETVWWDEEDEDPWNDDPWNEDL